MTTDKLANVGRPKDELDPNDAIRLRRLVGRRDRADAALWRLVRELADRGESQAAIGRAVGVTRAAIGHRLAQDESSSPAPAGSSDGSSHVPSQEL